MFSKQPLAEQTQIKFWAQWGKSLVYYTGNLLLTAKMSRALCCHLFVSDSDIRQPCIAKTAGCRAEQETLGPFEVSFVYTGYVLLLNIQGNSAVKPCIPIFVSCIPKTAGHRAKWMNVLGPVE